MTRFDSERSSPHFYDVSGFVGAVANQKHATVSYPSTAQCPRLMASSFPGLCEWPLYPSENQRG
jgi:hypothetical protein